jgi:hypothetical protein
VEEVSTILRDHLPRILSYPVSASFLSQGLRESATLDHLAFYFLYDSAAQMLLYDPAKSTAERYTVLVLRSGLPALRVTTLTGDLGHHEDTSSILVFPVKARIKNHVLNSVREHGLRPMQKWLAAGSEAPVKQRPLVLVYDESVHRVSAKFADDWTGDERDRQYF